MNFFRNLGFFIFRNNFFYKFAYEIRHNVKEDHDNYQVEDTIVINKVFLYDLYICKHERN